MGDADLGSPAPLSFGQDAYDLADPGVEPHSLQAAFRINGPLDVRVLESALRTVVEHNDCLRVRIHHTSTGSPVQTLHTPPTGPLMTRQLVRARSEEQFATYATKLRSAARTTPWNLADEPCFRFRLLRHTAGHHALLADFPRIGIDGTGRAIFVRRLWEAYGHLLSGRTVPRQRPAGDLLATIRRQRERFRQRSATANHDYWKRKFAELAQARAGAPTAPADPAEPVQPCLTRFVHLEGDRLASVRRECESGGVSLFQWVLSHFVVTVFRSRPQPLLELHCMMDTRDPGDQDLMGRFARSLPLLLPRTTDSDQALRDVRTELLHTMRHRHIGSADLRRALASTPRLMSRGAVTARFLDHGTGPDATASGGIEVAANAFRPAAMSSRGVELAVHDYRNTVILAVDLDSRDFRAPDADAFTGALARQMAVVR